MPHIPKIEGIDYAEVRITVCVCVHVYPYALKATSIIILCMYVCVYVS